MRLTRHIFVYLTFSAVAALLVVLFVQTAPLDPPTMSLLEKGGIAGVFITCAFFGISFTLRPNWIYRKFLKKKSKEVVKGADEIKRPFQGHHPDCSTFQTHTIRWRDTVVCTGCLGLFIGFVASILFMLMYLTIDIQFPKIVSFLILTAGLCILGVIFLENLLMRKHLLFHVLSNSALPICFFLITISTTELTGEFVDGFFTIVLCFLWIDTRIRLSKWRHGLSCTHCPNTCKMYEVSF